MQLALWCFRRHCLLRTNHLDTKVFLPFRDTGSPPSFTLLAYLALPIAESNLTGLLGCIHRSGFRNLFGHARDQQLMRLGTDMAKIYVAVITPVIDIR